MKQIMRYIKFAKYTWSRPPNVIVYLSQMVRHQLILISFCFPPNPVRKPTQMISKYAAWYSQQHDTVGVSFNKLALVRVLSFMVLCF